MSALIENKLSYFIATLNTDKNNTIINYFKRESRFLDIDHTHIARYRIKIWTHTQNCARYQCTMDWYLDRHINETDETEDESYDEKLVIKTWGRSTPSIDIFNTQTFIDQTNLILEKSKVKDIKKILLDSFDL